MHDWINMSGIWASAHKLADDRHNQKRAFSSSRYWNTDSHFYGLIGEILIHGLTGAPIDLELRIEGDDGFDFYDTDVKAATFYSDPHLKHPINAKYWSPFFILVAVKERQARYVGWTDTATLREATVRDYGYGPQRSLLESELNRDSFPPPFDAYSTS